LLVKTKGEPEQLVVGPPGKSRVVDIDPRTLAALCAHRSAMGALSLALARPDAFVLGALDGQVRHPERLSTRFRHRLAQARRKLGADALTLVRLHDLRHYHASLLLRDNVSVKVVSERLGHASPVDHPDRLPAHPAGTQREAAAQLAGLVFGS